MSAANEAFGCPPAVRDRWRTALPADARWYLIPHTRGGRFRLAAELRGLSAGSQVVLCDSWPRSRARTRALVSGAGIRLVREYVALPTLSSAGVLVEDDDTTAGYVAARFGSAPPAASWRGRLLGWLVPLGRAMLAGRWRGLIFGGRMSIGLR
jgi:hypothetical protein